MRDKSIKQLQTILEQLRVNYEAEFKGRVSDEDVMRWVKAELKERQIEFLDNRLKNLTDADIVNLARMFNL